MLSVGARIINFVFFPRKISLIWVAVSVAAAEGCSSSSSRRSSSSSSSSIVQQRSSSSVWHRQQQYYNGSQLCEAAPDASAIYRCCCPYCCGCIAVCS